MSYNIPDQGVTSTKYGNTSIPSTAYELQSVGQSALTLRPQGSSSGNIAISSSCGGFGTTAPSAFPITNLSVSLLTLGRPVFFGFISDGTTNPSTIGNSSSGQITITITRDGNLILNQFTNMAITGDHIPSSSIWGIDFPSAGNTHVYEAFASTAGGTALVSYVKLVAWEL